MPSKHNAAVTGFPILLVVLMLFASIASAQADPAAAPWPMAGHDPQYTGLSSAIGPATGTKQWDYATYDGYDYSSPAIAADGTIYVATTNSLLAINHNGTKRWECSLGQVVWNGLTIGLDGTIYAVTADRKLHAISPDGFEKWTYDRVFSSPAVGPDGTLYVGWYAVGSGRLCALDPNGSEKWRFSTGSATIYEPAIAPDGTIYAAASNGRIYVINPDGSEETEFSNRNYQPHVVIGPDGTLYAIALDLNGYATFCAINPDGSDKWTFPTTGQSGYLALGPDGTCYAHVSDPAGAKLYSIDDNGQAKWTLITGSSGPGRPIVDSAGTVYAAAGGKFLAIGSDGSIKWDYTSDHYGRSPAMGSDGTIYLAGYTLQAIGPGQTSVPPYVSVSEPSVGGTISGPVFYYISYTNATSVTLSKADVNLITTGTARGTVAISAVGNSFGIVDIYNITGDGTIGISIAAGTASNSAGVALATGPAKPFEVQSAAIRQGDWSMIGHDARHTGCSSFAGPDLPSLNWSYNLNQWPSDLYTVVDADGNIYAATSNYLHAISPGGVKKWALYSDCYRSYPAIGNQGAAYLATSAGDLFCISAAGHKWWNYDTWGSCSAPVIDPAGTIYEGDENGNVYAVTPDCRTRWSAAPGGCIYAPPAVALDGTAYVTSNGGKLAALTKSGAKKWTISLSDRVNCSPVIDSLGTIYVGCQDGNLFAINPDGSSKWQFTMPRSIDHDPAIGPDGTIYVGCYTRFSAVNPDGTRKWDLPIGSEVDPGPPIVDSEGTIYVGTDNHKLYAINPDGSAKWSLVLPNDANSYLSMGPDGTVYAGAGQMLYAIGEDHSTEAPSATIEGPSSPTAQYGRVTYTVRYNTINISLSSQDVIPNTTGTANGTVSVSYLDLYTRQICIQGCTGNGTIGISLAAGSARNAAGAAPEIGPSDTFTVSTVPPATLISPPSAGSIGSGPGHSVYYTVSYQGGTSCTLSAADITLNRSGTANGLVSIAGSGPSVRTVYISSITGEGTLGISIGAGTASNSGGLASAAGPSETFAVVKSKPRITISAPSASATSRGPVDYTITYANAGSVTLTEANVKLIRSGTATGTVSISGSGHATRTVTVSNITGDGSLKISISSATASNVIGSASSAGPSTAVQVVNTLPTIKLGTPSKSSTRSGPVSYTITYSHAAAIDLSLANVHLVATGTANGMVSVTGSGTTTRKVTVFNITGDGTLGISIDAGSASNVAGPTAAAVGAAFTVVNTPPQISISAPSVSTTKNGPVTFTVSYTGATSVSLSSSKVHLLKTGTATGRISVTGTGTSSRTITISSITGDGTLAISIDSKSASNLAGSAPAAGPSTAFAVNSKL